MPRQAPEHLVVVGCSEADDDVNCNPHPDAVLLHRPPAVPEGAAGPPRGDQRDIPREDPAAAIRHRDPAGPLFFVHKFVDIATRILQSIYAPPPRQTRFT